LLRDLRGTERRWRFQNNTAITLKRSKQSIGQKRQITTIVDADDKNCLVQLTVAQELNQGVRQRLYFVAGVLFFRSFFCTSKRKNIKTHLNRVAR